MEGHNGLLVIYWPRQPVKMFFTLQYRQKSHVKAASLGSIICMACLAEAITFVFPCAIALY